MNPDRRVSRATFSPWKGTLPLLLATVLLTSCSSGPVPKNEPSETPSSVYQFETPRYGAKDRLTVKIPQALKDVAPESTDLPFTSVEVTSHELNSARYCAVDLEIDWPEGAVDQVKNPDIAILKNGDLKTDVERVSSYLTGQPFKTDSGKMSSIALSIDDLKTSEPQPGSYAAADFGTLTLVRECAKSPTDDNATFEFNFRTLADSVTLGAFASFKMTVMKGGNLTIVDREIADYELDSNGTWLAD